MTDFDVVVLSHLRWDFVFQRPQHLMTQAARDHRVLFVEEAIPDDGPARLDVSPRTSNIEVVVPRGRGPIDLAPQLAGRAPVFWYYTPMALDFTRHLPARLRVYDCMDELSLFRGAPPRLTQLESELFDTAGVVFTGGHSLWEAKRTRHPRVHAFPSSVDVAHFKSARGQDRSPEDQAAVPRPRLGYYGVIDERLDLDLIAAVADQRPEWQIVMVGPVVKISDSDLPRRTNIHYLGQKSYDDLPRYLSGWNVALMPFARNDSTRFISPTKTPEYLAGGRPVVSTSIRDVVQPYGTGDLVRIADRPADFVAACEAAMAEDSVTRTAMCDPYLESMSWQKTWQAMRRLIAAQVEAAV